MARVAETAARSRSTLLIPFVLSCAILGDRAQIEVATGGRGVLPLLLIAAPVAAMMTIARYGSRRSLGFLANPIFMLGVVPYLALTALLPILGVMFHDYPERTLLTSAETVTAVSFLVLGAALSSTEGRSWSPWLLIAITFQLVYAAGQALYLSGGPGWELFGPFREWDLSLQSLVGQVVLGRSSGLYLNPNVLGLWAGVAVILGWAMLTPRSRFVGLSLAILTLLLSQSRGAAVALVAALFAGAALSVARGHFGSSTTLKAIFSFALAGLVALGAALSIESAGALSDRFGALYQILTEGLQADANLADRLDYWFAVSVLNSMYPWGTWGSPELLLGTAVDSSWFRTFAQGSVFYVAALALLTGASMFVHQFRYRHALRLITVLVAVAGLTQTPFSYPVIAVFWVFLGAGLQSSTVSHPAALPAARTPWSRAPGAQSGWSQRPFYEP